MIPTGRTRALALVTALATAPPPAAAEPVSLLAGSSLFAARGALVPAAQPIPQPAAPADIAPAAYPTAAPAAYPAAAPADPAPTAHGASLFAGRAGTGLFAPRAPRPPAPEAAMRTSLRAALHAPGPTADAAARIRHLIARAEAGRDGYDAVQHGARVRPAKPPTRMTIAEIYAWIAATPGQPHAIGRYQFIPSTLRQLVRELGIDLNTVFSPGIQDRLADLLLEDAGFAEFTAGRITRTRFMNNLAQIWAGLPTSSGKSHYHGFAGNRATMTWARFDAEMAQIFPG
ncbi:hypothetical protein [Rhodovulum marinum]|uniref:Muramidase (Phage lysozyme) n=1 Tax=Rhodovulum marinum TaxID=320662 RepID=A0A4R2Q7Y8_9RHOB|nr:hypothetical protein [Rhodovulum marinum]TCP42911.1 hypothetical protein EV662_102102 [Rhodovulum marinum]